MTDALSLIEGAAIAIGTFIAVVTFFYGVRQDRSKASNKVIEDIDKLKERVTTLETKLSPFWFLIEKELPKLLHSPHTPELDHLLEKAGFPNEIDWERLSEEEIVRAKKLLTDLYYHEQPKTSEGMIARFVILGADVKLAELHQQRRERI